LKIFSRESKNCSTRLNGNPDPKERDEIEGELAIADLMSGQFNDPACWRGVTVIACRVLQVGAVEVASHVFRAAACEIPFPTPV
jgi:hypothetical protein